MVGNTIQQGCGYFSIAKNRHPFGKEQIRGGEAIAHYERCLIAEHTKDGIATICARDKQPAGFSARQIARPFLLDLPPTPPTTALAACCSLAFPFFQLAITPSLCAPYSGC